MTAAEVNFIGVSFGTLYTSISIVGKDGRVETIANEDGVRNIPSCVAYTSHDELIGSQAKLQSVRNPRNTIVHFRNLLARSIHHKDVRAHEKEHRLTIVPSPDDQEVPCYEVDFWENPSSEPIKQYLTPAEITVKYLQKMKSTAEDYLGHPVNGCIISDPTSFDPQQSLELVAVTRKAGFEHVFSIKEPVAAALSFEADASANTNEVIDKMVLVLDFGGHNFNVSLLSSNKGLFSIIDSEDDPKLGGVELDELLVDLVANEFKRKTKLDVRENRRSLMKLRTVCEQTKRALSQRDMAPCSVESLYEGLDHHGSINRSRFEVLAEPLFQRGAALVKRTLTNNKLQAKHIDRVILVGGSSKVPRFQAVIRSLFPENIKFLIDSDPDESIAKGCITQANIIVSTGLDHYANGYADKKLHESVAHTSKDIGIADAQGNMCVLIPKSTPIPVLRTVRFSNSVKNQSELYLAILEGASVSASECTLMAELLLTDLPENMEIGEAALDVTFSIEKNLVLHVVAKEKASGKTVKVNIK